MNIEVKVLTVIIILLVMLMLNAFATAYHYKVLAEMWKGLYDTDKRIINKIAEERDRYYDRLVELENE